MELNINKNIVIEWAQYSKEICRIRMLEETETIGGVDDNGDPIVIKIDESLFFKRKYYRGRARNAQLVFGAVERESKNRTKETLLQIIRQRIRPGGHIISDGWREYMESVADGNYEFIFVIHEENVISPNNPTVHTKNFYYVWLRPKNFYANSWERGKN